MSKTFFKNTVKVCFIFFVAILISCSNLTMPKKITIQADPEIQASFGSLKTSLTDYFSVEKIQEMIGENENFQIYNYQHNDEDNKLRFLAKMDYVMPIEGLDVDGNLNELENMDPIIFGYEEDNITPSVLFSVPEINQTIELDPISLDLVENITDSIKDLSSIQFEGVQPGLINDLKNQNLPFLLELCDDEFDTVTFGEGTYLDIGFNQIPDVGVTTARINGIAIFDAAKFTGGIAIKDFTGNVDYTNLTSISMNDAIVYHSANSDLVNGTNLTTSLDLSNKTLPKDICLVLNVSFEGGDGNSSVTITTQNSKFSNISFKRVTGFNTTSPITVDFPDFDPIELSTELEDLIGAVIGSENKDGQISFEFNNLPQGVTPTTKISLKQDDNTYNTQVFSGLNISDQPLSDNKIYLAGQNLNTNPINILGNLTIEAHDADIDFTIPIEVTAGIEITNFAKVYISDTLIPAENLSQNHSYSLAEIAEYVTQINFEEVGLSLKLCNGLPFDATMQVTSAFLNKSNEPYDFAGNKNDLPESPTKIVQKDLTKDINKDTVFDLSININLPSTDGIITLQNITTGTDYKFYGQADLIIDWRSVFFKLPDDYSGFKGSFPEEESDPLDFSNLGDILGENLTLSGIEPKLYASSELLDENGPLSGATITAKMKATYTKDENLVTEYLVGSDSESKQLTIVQAPNLVPDDNLFIKGTLPEASLEIEDFDKLLCSGASDLKIEYDISLGGSTSEGELTNGFEIQKSQMENLSGESEVVLHMLIDLPIQFTVLKNENGYASFNISELMNKDSESELNSEEEQPEEESDLFNRDPNSSSNENDFDVFEFIENARIDIQYENNTGIALTLYIEDKNEQGQIFKKETKLGTSNGTMTLTLDEEDAKYINSTNPFNPDVLEVRLPGSKEKDTVYNILRDANINVTLQGIIKTNIDYTIDLSNQDNTEGEN